MELVSVLGSNRNFRKSSLSLAVISRRKVWRAGLVAAASVHLVMAVLVAAVRAGQSPLKMCSMSPRGKPHPGSRQSPRVPLKWRRCQHDMYLPERILAARLACFEEYELEGAVVQCRCEVARER